MAAEFMNTREAAAYTGIAYNTLVTWRSKGRGPEFMIQGYRTVVYRKADIDRFLREMNYVSK